MSSLLPLALVASPFALGAYAYVGYPLLLRALSARRAAPATPPDPAEWPLITITVPVYNEARRITKSLEGILALDYPAARRQVLVISDASTDGTDDIVRGFADRGVELLRLPARSGKSAAENAAGRVARGTIIVNIDASVQVPHTALKPLVRAFQDPTVGVASGRDVSIGARQVEQSGGESGYVGYEMWVRRLETRLGSIVGASGCFFGIRHDVHDTAFPADLSRDFASALIAREHGLRAVSVEGAVCYVPRTASLQSEYQRKIRTMARGLQTLWFKRHLLNPVRHGLFAWMLISHKLCRWLVYPALLLAVAGLALLTRDSWIAAVLLGAGLVALGTGQLALRWPADRRLPKFLALPGFLVASNIAGVLAWARALQGRHGAVWEPTRRPV